MKTQDLMIGDYVKLKSGRVVEITQVDGTYDTISYFDGDAGGELSPSIKDIEPIPLTPEILEKNGFKQFGKSSSCIVGEYAWGGIWERKSTTVTITFYKGLSNGVKLLTKIETTCSHEGGINMVHSCDIENIHELQHALRLCGIEKEIEP